MTVGYYYYYYYYYCYYTTVRLAMPRSLKSSFPSRTPPRITDSRVVAALVAALPPPPPPSVRLRTAYFKGSRLVAIEPLAARLLPHAAELPHIDLGDRERVWQLYSMPAEFRACEAKHISTTINNINKQDNITTDMNT